MYFHHNFLYWLFRLPVVYYVCWDRILQESSGFIFNCFAQSLPQHGSEKWEPGDKRRDFEKQFCCCWSRPLCAGLIIAETMNDRASLQRLLALHKRGQFPMASFPPKESKSNESGFWALLKSPAASLRAPREYWGPVCHLYLKKKIQTDFFKK